MRILRPCPRVLGFYDGRVENKRLYSQQPNWLDDGAYSLGVCCYAIHDGTSAVLFDTHISLEHAKMMRQTLEAMGIDDIKVVLSHHHTDHVAGNEMFSDCEIIAARTTIDLLRDQKDKLENSDPPIKPFVIPNVQFEGALSLKVGAIKIEVLPFEIHSSDGHVLWLPDQGALFAGDTLEDPITYVTEPDRLHEHLAELTRLARLPIKRILPNHGSEKVISSGGFHPHLITSTSEYIVKLLRCKIESELATMTLKEFAATLFDEGTIIYDESYEAVHRENVSALNFE